MRRAIRSFDYRTQEAEQLRQQFLTFWVLGFTAGVFITVALIAIALVIK